jgi:hypothetical protein
MRKLLAGHWLESSFWLMLAVAAYVYSYEFDRGVEMYKFGAAGWPRVIIILTIVAAVGQLIHQLLVRSESDMISGVDVRAAAVVPPAQATSSYVRLGMILGLPIVYSAFLEHTGFYFTTPIFLVAYLFVTGERRPAWLIGVPALIFVLVSVIFTRLLYIGLPIGYWPGFYDVGNWFVVFLRS